MSGMDSESEGSFQGREYHKIRFFLFLANLLISICFLLFFAVTGLSIFLRAYLRLFFDNQFILNGIFFISFYLAIIIFSFPLDVYEGFFLEHKFRLSKQNFFSWLKDYLKKTFLTFIVALIIVEAVYKFMGLFYNSWWIFASLLWLVITVFFAKIFPLIILPLFFKSRPLSKDDLKDRLDKLTNKFNFRLSDIFILELSQKTIKANAMVTGIGRTKRIYLSDTLLGEFSNEEIELVVAHELSHDRNKDIYRHIFVSFVVSIFSFYICDLFLSNSLNYFGYISKSDIANLPVLSLLILIASLFILPFQNAFFRYLERNADMGSIKITHNPKGFISMISKLGHKNLSEFSPNKIIELFLYDHPPISKRIKVARQFLG